MKKEDAKVSIIVPVYNVEKYLKECVNSLINQTYSNLEIILIDDGSTDNSPIICDNFKAKDKRIKVIHKRNEGLGLTRNVGIDKATGKYIYFVDSDDYIDLNTIKECVELAEKYDLQIVTFGFNNVDDNRKITTSIIPRANSNIYKGKDIQNYILPIFLENKNIKFDGVANLICSSSSSIYLLELIRKNNWKYVSEREYLSEDIFSLMDLYGYVTKIGIISKAFYYYRKNMDSLTHTYEKNKFYKNNNFLVAGIELCKKHRYNNEVIQGLEKSYLSNLIGILKLIENSNLKEEKRKIAMKKIVNNDILQRVLKNYKIRKEKATRKIFFLLLKRKKYKAIYLLIKAKNKNTKALRKRIGKNRNEKSYYKWKKIN